MVLSPAAGHWEHMTQALARSVAVDLTIHNRLGLPELSGSVVVRRRLVEALTAGSQRLLTVVEAPTGAGKTLGVRGWAAQSASADGVLWLNAGSYALDAPNFWARFRSCLLDLRAGPLPPVPSPEGADSLWASWLTTFADALKVGDATWIVVLDDYPTGPPTWLGQQIAAVSSRSGRALRMVVICASSPAFDLRGLRAAGEFSYIGAEELRMDESEVAEMLALRGVTPDAVTVSSVLAWSDGWACGVGLAARALQTSSWPEAVDGLDFALNQLLDREVLAQLPAAGRELIIRTSVATEVTGGLARAVMGSDVQLSPGLAGCQQGFVNVRPDGSFRCHPLLRRSALRRLDEDWPALAHEARQAAAGWYLDNGDGSAAIELAASVGEWSWVARALVRSLAVPSIVLGASDGIVARAAERGEVWTAEPIIAAAAAVQRGSLDEAEAVLARAGEKVAGQEPDLAALLSESVIRMAMSRQRSDHEAGLQWVAQCRRLAAELSLPQKPAPRELLRLLDAYEGAFLLWSGDLDRAFAVLEPAAQGAAVSGAEQVAAAECAGLLAWLEALRGNLTSAARHTAEVLRIRHADADEVGVGYAQLAAVWVHLERSELGQARQRLDHASRRCERAHEPWLVAAQHLAAARVETAGGEPDAALRMLASVRRTQPSASGGWLADRLTVAAAEAHLAAGDPQRALAALTPEPTRAVIEARVLAAAARRDIGDKRGAHALLTAVENRVSEAPLPLAVQMWSLEAQFAVEAGDNERARSLVRRALRAASREDLRLALSPVRPWLAGFVDRSPELSRSYRSLMAPLITSTPDRRTVEFAGWSNGVPTTPLLEPLTERELQILERLACLCTTEEIATDLFVSMNTVKTHIKSLFLKLSVNRRADAVRRGRGLGLC
jgi:LuxR family maltose regulon positive regulatory protein